MTVEPNRKSRNKASEKELRKKAIFPEFLSKQNVKNCGEICV